MKSVAIALTAVLLACGAPSQTTLDRADNAARGAQHEVDLELCLQKLQQEKNADAGVAQMNSDYAACVSDADKKAKQ